MEANLTSGKRSRNISKNPTQHAFKHKTEQYVPQVTSQPNMIGGSIEDREIYSLAFKHNSMSSAVGNHLMHNFSSGTTQRIQPHNQTVLDKKLPIISPRQTHLTVD